MSNGIKTTVELESQIRAEEGLCRAGFGGRRYSGGIGLQALGEGGQLSSGPAGMWEYCRDMWGLEMKKKGWA